MTETGDFLTLWDKGGQFQTVGQAFQPDSLPETVRPVRLESLTYEKVPRDRFLFNQDGDGGTKDKATDMSTFEAMFAQDIDFINS